MSNSGRQQRCPFRRPERRVSTHTEMHLYPSPLSRRVVGCGGSPESRVSMFIGLTPWPRRCNFKGCGYSLTALSDVTVR